MTTTHPTDVTPTKIAILGAGRGGTALLDLLHGTYRGGRTSGVDQVRALGSLEVTVSSDLLLFRQR